MQTSIDLMIEVIKCSWKGWFSFSVRTSISSKRFLPGWMASAIRIAAHQMTGSPASQITQSDFRLFVTGMAAVLASLLSADP